MQTLAQKVEQAQGNGTADDFMNLLLCRLAPEHIRKLKEVLPDRKIEIDLILQGFSRLENLDRDQQFSATVELLALTQHLKEFDLAKLEKTTGFSIQTCLSAYSALKEVDSLTLPLRSDNEYVLTQFFNERDPEQLGECMDIRRLKLVSEQCQQDQERGFVFVLLSYCKALGQLITENIQFIYELTQYTDRQHYSKKQPFRSLATQIFTPIYGSCTLELPYFSNLTYLYIQASVDMDSFVLRHDGLLTLKVESLVSVVRCFGIECPRLRRFNALYNEASRRAVVCSDAQFIHFFDSNQLQELRLCVQDYLHLATRIETRKRQHSFYSMAATSLRILEIYSLENPLAALQRGFLAKDLKLIPQLAPELTELHIRNIVSAVRDEHVLTLIQQIASLQIIELSQNPQGAVQSSQATDVFEKVFKTTLAAGATPRCMTDQYTFEEIKASQYAITQLILCRCAITDQLMYYFYLLDIHYQIRKFWIEDCQLVTDSTVFILLTSTQIFQNNPCRPRFQTKWLETTPLQDGPYRNSTKSVQEELDQTIFNCYLHDNIEDEKKQYQLTHLSIIGSPKISLNIIYALLYSCESLQFFQFDSLLCYAYLLRLINMREDIFLSFQDNSGLFRPDFPFWLWKTRNGSIKFEDLLPQQ